MLCSIIIPTYNRASYLDAAIDSVMSLMVPGDELNILDDGCVDDASTVL